MIEEVIWECEEKILTIQSIGKGPSLKVLFKKKVFHNEEVSVSYDALYCPDLIDIDAWGQRAAALVDEDEVKRAASTLEIAFVGLVYTILIFFFGGCGSRRLQTITYLKKWNGPAAGCKAAISADSLQKRSVSGINSKVCQNTQRRQHNEA